jgi:hypothetical protein
MEHSYTTTFVVDRTPDRAFSAVSNPGKGRPNQGEAMTAGEQAAAATSQPESIATRAS